MRFVIATCSIEYRGRLTATLPSARRLILLKSDGTLIVHADRGHKALNWMSPPTQILERDGCWTVTGPKGEVLEIRMEAIHSDTHAVLGDEPGLVKSGSERELQELLAAEPGVVVAGARLVSREFPTDVGPVDLLLRDAEGRTIAVEVKRVGELAAVEQIGRYVERLDRDPTLAPVRGVLVAQTIKPQTRALAAARDIVCVEVDFEALAGRIERDPTLF